ncbi:O-succinylbenzoate synthase [Pseudoclavibacter sp. RFBI5]|uniref:o-succinylbenzoate synthase n=1 Tax=Pseudoclavibacter sp. RFBI5 TaxID=2080578 RepID=UPI000CE85D0C|nr:o-succinylbenzoate synthase [Pseudoclavibacter sp. RFBI5]PPG01628.1 O-succinylbenzoate synthase [Pseudoclavibacter sp. RFBI5]
MQLPEIDELLDRTHIVTLPLVTRFRGVDAREVAIIRGTVAWSEFSPFLEYGDAEAASWLRAAIEFGFDETLGRHTEGEIWVNATVPAVGEAALDGVLARFDGCRTAKVKVAERGQTLADDIARVAGVRERLGADARLRVDANGGWSVDDAVTALRALARFGLEYAEQPCATTAELGELRGRLRDAGIEVPIAADESIRKADDPLEVARLGAADVVVVKMQPLGGIRRAVDIVASAGLPATVSSALDSSVGIAMGAQLAAALPAPRHDAGLGTASLLAEDVVTEPLRPRAGRIPLAPVTVDEAALKRLASPAERQEWWRERLRSCHALLAGGSAQIPE